MLPVVCCENAISSKPQKKFENDFYFGYNMELRIEIGGKSAARMV
jgi:hypothetical protein